MTYPAFGRKNLLAAIFLVAMTISHLATLPGLIPYLRSGYQNFTIFYAAGKLVREGKTGVLYDLSAQYRVQEEFAPNVPIRHGALPYNHPPFEALLFVPFAAVAYWQAYLLWTVLNLLLLAASLRLLRNRFPDLQRVPAAFLYLVAASFYPVVSSFIQGQDCILLLAVCTFALIAFDQNQDIYAGAALAAGLFRFQLVLPMVLILAVRRPRLLLGFAPVAGILAAVSVGMLGWQGSVDYVSFILSLEKSGAGGSIVVREMPNLRGIFAGLPGVGTGLALVAGTIVCSLVVLAIAMRRMRVAEDSPALSFILATIAALLVGYHTLAYDLSLLLPALLLLFCTCEKGSEREGQFDVMLLVLLLLLTSNFVTLGTSATMLVWFGSLLAWLSRKRHLGRTSLDATGGNRLSPSL